MESRRKVHSLTQFFKIIKSLTPPYLRNICNLIPHNTDTYNLRRNNSLLVPFIRKEIFSKSFFPKTIREWNNLSLEMKESDSINIFKEKLKRLYGPNKSKKLYSHGHGWHTVNHCRIRLGLSHLKHHLFRYNIIQSAYYENVTCDNLPETSSHFLLYCPRYEPQRRSMLKEISKIIFPGTSYITVIALMSDHLCNILLHGSEDLSLEENKKAFD